MLRPLGIGSLLLFLGAGVWNAAPQNPPPPSVAAAERAETLRDIEVFRRVLAREIGGSRDTGIWFSGSFSGVGGGASSFWIPGDGALVLLQSGLVLHDGGDAPSGAEPAGPVTVWDEVKAEVEGKPLPRRKGRARRYDAAEVESLKTRLLEAMGRFGRNIAHLGAGDHLTLVVRGSSAAAIDGFSTNDGNDHPDDFRTAIVSYSGNLLSSDRSSATTLVIRIARSDSDAFASGKIDAAELAKRAQIAQY